MKDKEPFEPFETLLKKSGLYRIRDYTTF